MINQIFMILVKNDRINNSGKKNPMKSTENATYNKPHCLTGDKGYIIDKTDSLRKKIQN